MKEVDRSPDDEGRDSVDNLIVSLRAYVTRAPEKPKPGKVGAKPKATKRDRREFLPKRIPPSDWVLVFDCETRTTPDQRLRFGGYQLRNKGRLFERGAFYEPDVLSAADLAVVRTVVEKEKRKSGGERVQLLTWGEFVEDFIFASGRDLGAQIVGFNLPFDLSRLAVAHSSARYGMRGGFSLQLSKDDSRARVAVKHLSQKAAMIRFTGERGDEGDAAGEDIDPDKPHESEKRADPDRGYFVDVKTIAAALLSGSHSLESLSELLDVATKKQPSDEHGGPLTPEYVGYGLRDVQTTWECFEALAERFAKLDLEDTGLYDLYSEASLGKAYLRTMKVGRWRELQPKFPPKLIGQILSAYYGGRAEVHIRRQIAPVIHCDFLSMYPTVCTLMGLWRFVCAKGIRWRDDTERVCAFLDRPPKELVKGLRSQAGWSDLAVLVQVAPNDDLFPVRAAYPGGDTATIGLNFLKGDDPFWFTLADVIVSAILTGRTPKVLNAIRFEPMEAQSGLKPLAVAGEMIDPATNDFYRRLIIHRNALKAEAQTANETDRPALDSDQQAVKTLASATSYGIFVELNVEDYPVAKPMIGHGAKGRAFKFKAKKFEKPGQYFHPLLGTLITGAARLMLALAERQVIEQGLDWAFCDTDSIAIANVRNLPFEEFKAKTLRVQDWFAGLNPYGEPKSILQLEKVNFPPRKDGDLEALAPPLCLAVSAKRYVLFNRIEGAPIIRKASGHGLGHLLSPYDEPTKQRRDRIRRIGVPLWQEDVWREIIRAAESDAPDQAHFIDMPGFDGPAASPYAATTPELLRWFDGYNRRRERDEQVFPFGFLLSLQAKSRPQMANDEPEALSGELWRRREPRPAAPYFKRAIDAVPHAFDRERDQPIPASWLKSHGRSLIRYHLHPELKFWGGEFDQRDVLRRRHVVALAQQPIGKESDNIDENEFLGEDAGPLEHPMEVGNSSRIATFVFATQGQLGISDRVLLELAKVSPHTLIDLRAGHRARDDVLRKLVGAAEQLRQELDLAAAENKKWLQTAWQLSNKYGGRNKFAALLGVSGPYLGRVLRGAKPLSEELIESLRSIQTCRIP